MLPTERIFALSSFDFVYLLVPVTVQTFVYGIYTTLFAQCMYVFRKRRLARGRKFILTGTIFLFFFCTIQYGTSAVPLPATPRNGALNLNTTYITSNLIADILFTYRCYIIWNRGKSILCVLLLLVFANTAFGVYCSVVTPSLAESISLMGKTPLIFSLGTNVILTLFSAGRIWWISQRVRILGPQVSQKYNTAITLIVESGAIYCVALIAYLISIANVKRDPTPDIFSFGYSSAEVIARTFYGILTQIVGIVPTLMVVRTGLGISAEDAQTVVLASGIRFDQGEASGMGTVTNRESIMSSNAYRHTLIIDRTHEGGAEDV